MSKLKMYILVREDVPLGIAMTSVAHASLAAYLRFAHHPETIAWLDGPFYKTICIVTEKEFEKAKETDDHVVITESSYEGQETVIAFRPRTVYPKMFNFFRLYR